MRGKVKLFGFKFIEKNTNADKYKRNFSGFRKRFHCLEIFLYSNTKVFLYAFTSFK
jgi:hypothetical protein